MAYYFGSQASPGAVAVFGGESSGVDTVPEAFSFTDVEGQTPNTLTTSDAITVAGVTAGIGIPVSITGGEWQSSDDEGETWGSWTSSSGSVQLGDQVRVRATSSTTEGATVDVVLTIGTVSDTFSIVTQVAGSVTLSGVPTVFRRGVTGTLTINASSSFTLSDVTITLNSQPLTKVSLVDSLLTFTTPENVGLMYADTGLTLQVMVSGIGTASANNRQFQPASGFSYVPLVNPATGQGAVGQNMTNSSGGAISPGSDDQYEWSTFTTENAIEVTLTPSGYASIDPEGVNFGTQTYTVRHIPSSTGIPGSWATQSMTQTLGTDLNPDIIWFISALFQAPSVTVQSNVGRVTGADAGINIPVSVAGGQWRKSVNDGSTWSSWTASAGTVQVGNLVQVQGTSSNTLGGSVFVDLTIGEMTTPFGIYTKAADDIMPNQMYFPLAVTGTPGAMLQSTPITISGVTPGVNIPITGANNCQWRTSTDNGATWSAYSSEEASGFVQNGWQIQVQAPAGGSVGARQETVLFVSTIPVVFMTFVNTGGDLSPTPFTFAPSTGLAPGTVVETPVLTVAGLTAGLEVPAWLNGGEWHKSTDNGVTWGEWATYTWSLKNGDQFQLRGVVPQPEEGPRQLNFTLGTYNTNFVLTPAEALDVTPDALVFTTANNQTAGAVVQSNAATVTGVTAGVAIPVTIAGGEWQSSSNGGTTWSAYSSSAGTVQLSHQIRVRATASNTPGGQVQVDLTVGGVQSLFTVNTIADTTPDAYNFTAATNVAINTVIQSNTATIAGVTAGANVPVTVTGGEWRYSINGGSTWSAYTSAGGNVQLGNLVQVRGTSSGSNSTTSNVVLTIGGVSATFAITTAAVGQDTTPDSFTFTPAANVSPSTVAESNAVTITGVTAGIDIPVSIVNGSYQTSTDNGNTWGSWTSANGNVQLNHRLRARGTSNSTPSGQVIVTVSIGGVVGDFVITTSATNDTTPAAFSFTPATNQTAGVSVVSNAITITEVTSGVDIPVSVTGGQWQYSTDNGGVWSALSASPGNVRLNNLIRVQGVASMTSGGTVNVVLTAGGVQGTFAISTAEAVDTTPDNFTFTAAANQAAGAVIASNAITIAGVTAGVNIPVSVTGGEWRSSSNGGSTWTPYSASNGNVQSGHQIQVQGVASSTGGATVNVSLTAGGVTGVFAITTSSDDTIPNPFTFTPATGAALNAVIESNAVEVTGVTAGINIPITVSGGSYRVSLDAGTTWTPYTTSAGTVQLGNRVQVRGTASSSNSTTVSVTLSIGSVQSSFAITTVEANDVTPNPFSFTSVTDAALGTSVDSNEIQVLGVTSGVDIPVSVTGGSYRVSSDGGSTWSAYTSSAGNVRLNYRVQVRVESASVNGATTQAILTIGGVQGTFAVTTVLVPGTVIPPRGRVIPVGMNMTGFAINTGDWQSPNVVTRNQKAGEKLDYAFNFLNVLLAAQDTIQSFQVVTPTGLQMTNPSLAANGTYVVFWIEGAEVGNTYNITCKITTTQGRIIVASFKLVGVA